MAEIDWAKLAEGPAGQAAKILETGAYNFVVTKAVAARTNAGDKDTIKATLVVEGGPRNGTQAWHQFTITPDSEGSMAMFFRQMGAFGLDQAFFATLQRGSAGVGQIAAALVQRRVRANVIHETYNDEPRVRLERFAKAAGPGAVPAPGVGAVVPPRPVVPVVPAGVPSPVAVPQPVAAVAAPVQDDVAGAYEPAPADEDEPF
jgi:hypothetical protein